MAVAKERLPPLYQKSVSVCQFPPRSLILPVPASEAWAFIAMYVTKLLKTHICIFHYKHPFSIYNEYKLTQIFKSLFEY